MENDLEDDMEDDIEEEEEIYPMPKSVGMGASGMPDLAQRCEELLWGRKP